MIKNDSIQLGDKEAPIVGATYLWQNQIVNVIEVLPSVNIGKLDVVVEYFSKAGKCFCSLRTAWLPGNFKLTFVPEGKLSRNSDQDELLKKQKQEANDQISMSMGYL